MKNKFFIYYFLIAFIFISCNNEKSGDTTTWGEIKISVDETFAPIIDSQIDTFQKIYSYAKINVSYKPEAEIMYDLLSDSSRIVIIPRKLNASEKKFFDSIQIVPKVLKIFYDAVAVIVNNKNIDTNLTFLILKNILTGKVSKWSQVNKKSNLSEIQIIFDNPNSSTVRFIKDKIAGNLPKNCYAVKTGPAVIDYVSKNINAIGLLGVNWLSDRDDTVAQGFLKTVKIVGLTNDTPNVNPNEYYQPLQAYIYQKFYPLYREVYIISREARAGLGTGFSAFVAGEKGQRIFLKSGLVPATMPIRLVEIDHQEL